LTSDELAAFLSEWPRAAAWAVDQHRANAGDWFPDTTLTRTNLVTNPFWQKILSA